MAGIHACMKDCERKAGSEECEGIVLKRLRERSGGCGAEILKDCAVSAMQSGRGSSRVCLKEVG